MKQFKNFFYKFSAIVILLNFCCINASFAQSQEANMDSVEFSLLTCSPHDEVYSIYGHTAIRLNDKNRREDWTFNYGVFDFKKPYFVARFLFGLTDYQLGVLPYDIFKREYGKQNRQVVEQVLNLTATEKLKLYSALMTNYEPENRVYRYNFLYNNCTTKARDIIESCIDGKVEYAVEEPFPSYREMIHEHSLGYEWIEFGNDMCMGAKADIPTDLRKQQFLPLRLSYDFNRAQIYSNGTYRPLVKRQAVAVAAGVQVIEPGFPLSPTACALIFLGLSVAIAFVEHKRKKAFKAWDVTLMAVTGICSVLLLLLFVSQHPTTSTNLQILVLNPMSLFFIYKVIKGKQTIYWKLSAMLIILFLIGRFFQDYADGMIIVALSLLMRSWIHLKKSPHTTKR